MARCPPTSAEFTVIRIVLREALVSSTRLKKVFARFTAEGVHVPLMVGTVLGGIQSGTRLELPPPAQMAMSLTQALLRGIGRPEVRKKADLG
jgi:hypothetical protein